MKEIIAYKCDFCGKLYQRKNNAILHEARCSKNPDNQRACFGCANLSKKAEYVYFDYPDGYQEKVLKRFFYCDVKEHFVYPPIVGHKKNMPDIIEINKEMPKECEFRENSFNDAF